MSSVIITGENGGIDFAVSRELHDFQIISLRRG